jgi:predicted ester cyclase
MKLTAEDYRRHYRELTDAEFLAIDRDELVDVARRCYDAELAHRQLAPQPVSIEDAQPASTLRIPSARPGEELVRVAAVASLETATYAHKLLQEADISAELKNTADLPANLARGRFILMVPVSCAEEASDLLAGVLAGENQDLVRHWFEQEWTPEDLDLNDFSVTIDDLFGESGKVAVRLTIEGIDPQTGKEVKLGGLAIAHVVQGKIAESWVKLDR